MPAPQFKDSSDRYDPYKSFRFKIKCDNTYVAGVSKISIARSGDPITLQGGLTCDAAFEQWANTLWDHSNSRNDFRKDVTIELYDEAGQKVMAYNAYRCWVSEFQALPELDAIGNGVAIQTLKLENESWERDQSVTEPTEQNCTGPSSS